MANRKKVLLFIDWYLPGFRAGGPIQSCANLIEHLGKEFEFLIITRDTDYCETKPYAGISVNQWNESKEGSKVYYISESQLNYSTLKRIIHETEFDIAYINGIYSFYFSILPLYFLRTKSVRKIVSVRGMLAASAIGVKAWKKKIFLAASKFWGLYKQVIFQASTLDEVSDIEKVMGADSKILLAPNFPKRLAGEHVSQKKKQVGKLRLVNIARLAPEKNLLFALKQLAFVKSEVEFHFYGPIYDEGYFDLCKAAIHQLPSNIKVEHKGAIESTEVASTLQNYHAMYMPTLGENFGHIIFEAFQNGTPVIISDQTPWKNLQSKNIGFDLDLDQAATFSDAIEIMANWDETQLNAASKSAIDFAQRFSSNPEILKQNLHLFADNL